MRAQGRLTLILALLAGHLFLHGIWRLLRLPSPWPRLFLHRAGWAAGVDIRVNGRPLRRNVLYVANHLSWLDILIVAGVSGSRFVAKDDVRETPGLGWLAGLNDTVYVARAERGRVHEQAERVRAALAEGRPVTLFPEGGTGPGTGVGAFRASLLAALLPPQPGICLQPVAIDFGADAPVVAWPDANGMGAEMMRILAMPGRRRVTLHFLDPIDPAAMPDRKRLSAAARAEICTALGECAPLAV